MSDLTLPVVATQDAITDTQPTVSNDDVSQAPVLVTDPQPPVLVTEQVVMLGTAAAVLPRSTPITQRMIGALRVVAAALRPPSPRPHYPRRALYIERAAMSREMVRL
jgi:hypothetical protein